MMQNRFNLAFFFYKVPEQLLIKKYLYLYKHFFIYFSFNGSFLLLLVFFLNLDVKYYKANLRKSLVFSNEKMIHVQYKKLFCVESFLK